MTRVQPWLRITALRGAKYCLFKINNLFSYEKYSFDAYAPTMLTLPSLSGFPRHFTLPARS